MALGAESVVSYWSVTKLTWPPATGCRHRRPATWGLPSHLYLSNPGFWSVQRLLCGPHPCFPAHFSSHLDSRVRCGYQWG